MRWLLIAPCCTETGFLGKENVRLAQREMCSEPATASQLRFRRTDKRRLDWAFLQWDNACIGLSQTTDHTKVPGVP